MKEETVEAKAHRSRDDSLSRIQETIIPLETVNSYETGDKLEESQAIEDFEYTKWLDPSGVPCYVKDEAEAPDTDEGGRYKL